MLMESWGEASESADTGCEAWQPTNDGEDDDDEGDDGDGDDEMTNDHLTYRHRSQRTGLELQGSASERRRLAAPPPPSAALRFPFPRILPSAAVLAAEHAGSSESASLVAGGEIK